MTIKVLKKKKAHLAQSVRVSLGSAINLGLVKGRLDAIPTTTYLLTHREEKCLANCAFCPQARESKGRADMLSRVSWPIFQTSKVIDALRMGVEKGNVRRICIQALKHPEIFSELLMMVKEILSRVDVPISVSCQPMNKEKMSQLVKVGVERISIALDAATEQIFDRVKGRLVKGPYIWKEQLELLNKAVQVFGKGKVSTHLIVGLGETEIEMVQILQKCVDMGVLPALFAFTPVLDTAMEARPQPLLSIYRRVQLCRYLIYHRISRSENFRFDRKGRITHYGVDKKVLETIVMTGKPFVTSGCQDCNRPYYNEKPAGPIYNYPRSLTEKEKERVMDDLGLY